MVDLKQMGVQELNIQEQKNVNGGAWPLAIAIGALALAALNTDWDQAADDFCRGYNHGQ